MKLEWVTIYYRVSHCEAVLFFITKACLDSPAPVVGTCTHTHTVLVGGRGNWVLVTAKREMTEYKLHCYKVHAKEIRNQFFSF